MSLWNEIHIRQKVELSLEVMKKPFNFGSTIVRKNDTAIFFPMPPSQHSAAAFRKGAPCEVTIHAENIAVLFNGEIADVQPGSPAPTVQINRPPEEALRKRSASGTGVKVEMPLTFRLMKDPVTPISDLKKGDSVSIGANDATIHTVQQIKPGAYIELNLTLPGDTVPITLVGLVEDSSEFRIGELVSFKSFIKYEMIRGGDQDKLVKFIFDTQRVLRKRGLY